MGTTLVLQSHRSPLPHGWLTECLASVREWANTSGYRYRFLGDELFDLVPPDILALCADRLVVATDIARLHLMQACLAEGFDTVVWCDADLLVLDPARFTLPDTASAVGRQVWVQRDGRRLRTFRQVHNAVLLGRTGNPFLPFYLDVAERRVRAHRGPMVPQLVGPKLLTALHNVVSLPVIESANMLPPAVVPELWRGGRALDTFLRRCSIRPAALNLCASLAESRSDSPLIRFVSDVRGGRFHWPDASDETGPKVSDQRTD